MKRHDPRRQAMTLIELMVVIVLVSVLATLAAMILPSLRAKDNAGKAATALVANLSIAKQQALRDGAPRGLRFIPDYDLDPSGNTCREFQYVELPPAIVPKSVPGRQATLTLSISGTYIMATLNGATVDGSTMNNSWTLHGAQLGDYLYANYQGRTYVGYVAVDPASTGANLLLQVMLPANVYPGMGGPVVLTEGFQIIRKPRPLVGEENIQLPPKMVIDLSRSLPSLSGGGWNALADPRDIIFLPSGEVSGSPEGKIVLWVQMQDDTDIAKMNLVVIYTRTGQIVIHPVAVGSDPYAFTKDGQGSGL